jgi:hypothetical protein
MESEMVLFPLGMYDMPRNDDEWRTWHEAGIRLMPANSPEKLDLVAEHHMLGWARVPMIVNTTEDEKKLVEAVERVKDHPALTIWQAPDEPIHFAGKLVQGEGPIYEPWYLSPEEHEAWMGNLGAVVDGMLAGSEIIRELDPTRPIWLNDTAGCHRDARARVADAFDVMGFDIYPVGKKNQPLELFGRIIDAFREDAPKCDIWPVQQAFSWSLIKDGEVEQYPTRDELRFIAWQSLTRGVTGLHWWGVRHVEPGHPFLDLVLAVAKELQGLNDLLTAPDLKPVNVRTHYLRFPPALGVNRVARRANGHVLLALVNEDPWYHNAIVSGLDEIGVDDPNDLEPLTPDDTTPGYEGFTRVDGGWVIPMEGHAVKVWTA